MDGIFDSETIALRNIRQLFPYSISSILNLKRLYFPVSGILKHLNSFAPRNTHCYAKLTETRINGTDDLSKSTPSTWWFDHPRITAVSLILFHLQIQLFPPLIRNSVSIIPGGNGRTQSGTFGTDVRDLYNFDTSREFFKLIILVDYLLVPRNRARAQQQ